MDQDITELVDEPEIIDASDDISIDRWTKYGHDRLYINGARVEPYIDLEDGSLGDTGMVRVDAEFDGDVVTIEIGREDDHSRHDTIVISLSGEVEQDEDDDDDEAEEQTDVSTDDGTETANIAEPTSEHVAEVGYNKAAGQAQQAEAQRIFGVGGGTQDLSTDGDFDFECPHCGADANDSTEKPYCSKECAEDDLNGGVSA